jgi:hypothetical protein
MNLAQRKRRTGKVKEKTRKRQEKDKEGKKERRKEVISHNNTQRTHNAHTTHNSSPHPPHTQHRTSCNERTSLSISKARNTLLKTLVHNRNNISFNAMLGVWAQAIREVKMSALKMSDDNKSCSTGEAVAEVAEVVGTAMLLLSSLSASSINAFNC